MEVKAKQHPFAPGVADAEAAERPFSANSAFHCLLNEGEISRHRRCRLAQRGILFQRQVGLARRLIVNADNIGGKVCNAVLNHQNAAWGGNGRTTLQASAR